MRPRFETISALFIALIAAAEIGLSWNPDPFGQTLAVLGVVIALAHGRCVYGWKNVLAFFVITLAVTLIVENIGAATGVPFGHYHFVVTAGLPLIGRIPLVAGLLWFGMGYFSWQVAAILLDDADARLEQRGNLVALPLIAAFVMTQWDFVMDRASSTLSGAWAWHDGGPDFGVPLSNYAGWFVTSWSFYQLYAAWLARSAVAAPAPSLRLIAVILYAAAGLTHLIPWLSAASGEIIDASGRVWRADDIRAMSVAVMLLTMFFSSTLAAIKIARRLRERRPRSDLDAPDDA